MQQEWGLIANTSDTESQSYWKATGRTTECPNKDTISGINQYSVKDLVRHRHNNSLRPDLLSCN